MIAVAFAAGGERLVPWYTGVAAGQAGQLFDALARIGAGLMRC